MDRPKINEIDLFFESIVDSHVKSFRFLPRHWLVDEVNKRLNNDECRFILITTEPGAGKSAFIAQLASDHPSWLRYFIRRDQRSPMDIGVRSFLLKIGFQLAALKPNLFDRHQVELVVDQHIGKVTQRGEVVAAEVGKILSSPFHQAVIKIRQKIKKNQGNVTGLRIGEWITDPLLLEISDLQNMAIFGPARALSISAPDEKIIIMVDALDELRYHEQEESTVLQWLINCQELPSNIRFILTSRPPEGQVQAFLEKQQHYIDHLWIDPKDPRITEDLNLYVHRLVEEVEIRQSLALCNQSAEVFCEQAINKAEGNIGYLDALARGIHRSLERKNGQNFLQELINLEQLPDHVQGLYAFFLHQIKNHVANRKVVIEDPQTGEDVFLNSWPTLYMRVLAVLSVSFEPLTIEQIMKMGGIQAGRDEVVDAMGWLMQFLDSFDNRFALYHATLPEFLTSRKTYEQANLTDLYVNANHTHRRMALNNLRRHKERWSLCEDRYALRYTPSHFMKTITLEPEQQALTESLAKLLFNIDFIRRKADLIGIDELISDLHNAIRYGCFPEEEIASDISALKEILDLEAHNFRGWSTEEYELYFLQDVYNRAVSTSRRALETRLQEDLDNVTPPYIIVELRIGRESPNLLRTLSGHRNHITSLAPLPDDGYLLSGDSDGLIKLWNLQTGQEVRSLYGHDDGVTGLAVIDQKKAISASGDGTIRIWEIDSGREIYKFEGQESQVINLCLTADRNFAVLVYKDGTIRTLDLEHYTLLWTLTDEEIRPTAGCITSDNQHIVTGGLDRIMRVWDLKSGDQIRTEACDEITVLAAIPNRKWVVAGKYRGVLEIWDWEELKQIKTLSGLPRGVTGVAVTADGCNLVAGSWSPYQYDYVSAFDDSVVKIWSLETGSEIQALSSHTAGISAVATSNDSRLAISGAADSNIKVWQIKPQQQPLAPPTHNGPVKALATAADNKFVSCSADGTVKVWDYDTFKEYYTLAGHRGEVNCVSVNQDGRYALTGSHNGEIILWDLLAGQHVQTLVGHEYRVYGVAFLPDGKRAISAGADGTIRIWEIKSGNEIQTLIDDEGGWIFSLAITIDGRFVTTGCSQGKLQIWDLKNGKQIHSLTLEGGNIEVLAPTPTGEILAYIQNGKISQIDPKNGELLKSIELNQKGYIRGMGVYGDGQNAIAISWKAVFLFNVITGKVITRANLDSSPRSVCLLPNSQKIIVGDEGGNLYRMKCVN